MMISWLLFFCVVVQINGQDIPLIQKRIVEDILTQYSPSIINNVNNWMKSQDSTGKWPDIQYTQGPNAPRADWQSSTHLARCLDINLAYYSTASPLHQSAPVLASAQKCINYWFNNDYNNEGCTNYHSSSCPNDTPGLWNPNWWWNMVGIPQAMSSNCILMLPNLDATQQAHCIKIMNRANYTGFTAANILFMAIIQVTDGVVGNNLQRISKALNDSYDQLEVLGGSQDGIKIDGTFFQHDRQLYNEGYGLDFINAILQMLYYTQGTSFVVKPSQIAALSILILDGNAWLIHCTNSASGCVWFISAAGREITRDYVLTPRIKTNYLRTAAQGWPLQSQIDDFCDTLEHTFKSVDGYNYPLSGNKIFWKSDGVVHRRAGWSVNLKMFSTRTRNSECVNSENLQGVHLSDGALYVYLTGHEYDTIFDVWNWYRIPGITVDYGAGVLDCSHTSYIGLNNFVGGTTDQIDGVACFDFIDPQTKAYSYKKSWFFFDDVVAVLISDIACTKTPCNTNHVLDSRHLVEPVSGPAGNVSFPTNGTVNITGLAWLHHNSIGYFFNGKGNIYVDIGKGIHGDWSKIGVSTKKDVQDIFTAWVEDQSPSYSYLMLPGVELDTFQSLITSKTLTKYDIVQNDANIQAVFDSINNRAGVIFWRAGSFTYTTGWNIDSSAPSVVLFKQINTNTLTLSVADPTQSLKELNITIDRAVSCTSCHCGGSCTCGKCTTAGSKTTIQFTLPTGENAGSSIIQTLTKSK